MKDSIIKGTGNSRTMKSSIPAGTTWEQALAMLREGTFPLDLNGINTDGFQQVGSALSKANLLPDDTAEALGLDPADDPQVKDGFEATLEGIENTFRVGDIRSTVRNTLGEKWVLANGDFVMNFDAPDYVAMRNEQAAGAPDSEYFNFELPDIDGVLSLCFAVTYDNMNNRLLALGGVPVLVGPETDSYSTAWDIWLYQSTDGGFTWSTIFKWMSQEKPYSIASSGTYADIMAGAANTINNARRTLHETLCTAFVCHKGVPIWLMPYHFISTSTTSSSQSTVYDKLIYYNGTQSVDITNQYKYVATISSIATSDWLFCAYETEIDTSGTEGVMLFIGTSSRNIYLAISVSGTTARVTGRAAYGTGSTLGNINPDGQQRSLLTNGVYAHNVRTIVKIPNSNYSLLCSGNGESSAYMGISKLDCTRLFSTGLVDGDTWTLLKYSGNSVYNTYITRTSQECVVVDNGAVMFWVYGSSSSYTSYVLYLPWSVVLNWDASSQYWGASTFLKSFGSPSDYTSASKLVCPLGLILGVTSGPNNTLRCMCDIGMGDLVWNSSTWTFSLVTTIFNGQSSVLPWTSLAYTWNLKFVIGTFNGVVSAIPYGYREYGNNYQYGHHCSGYVLPHVDAMYGYLHNSRDYYGRLDGISNVFVKIKE